MAGRGNAIEDTYEGPVTSPLREDTGAPFVVEDWAPIADHDPRPLVNPGEYSAVCTDARKAYHRTFKREMIILTFEIADGANAGVRLPRYYPAELRPGRGSFYYREWTVANGYWPPHRRDRMSLSMFEGKLFLIGVKTVERAWDKRPLPSGLRYSKVDSILKLLTTNEPIR